VVYCATKIVGVPFDLSLKMEKVGLDNCFISQITVAELKYGALKSLRPAYQTELVTNFSSKVEILPILPTLDLYAQERLEALGQE